MIVNRRLSLTAKTLSIIGFCVLMGFSGFFQTDNADASYILEQKCIKGQSKKRSLENRKKICACVAINLESRLDKSQMKDLEKIYDSKTSRILATKDDKLKPLVDMDFEVNKNCMQNSLWRFPKEDLGTPDSLKD